MTKDKELEEILHDGLVAWATFTDKFDTDGGVMVLKRLTKELSAWRDNAVREALKNLPFIHHPEGWCAKSDKKFKECAACIVDNRIKELQDGK